MSCRKFLLLYGSQTGQAQAIAEQILERAASKGLTGDLHCLDQTEKKFFLEKEPVFVVVVSTTGEGDPPDNVIKFWRKLRRKTLPKNHLAGCKFALLGLGDTNYTNFCNMGKNLNRRLLELGAVALCPPGFADDGVGLELVVEPWIDALWLPLTQVLEGKEPSSNTTEPGSNIVEPSGTGMRLGTATKSDTGDGKPKVSGEETVEPTTSGKGPKAEINLESISGVDSGNSSVLVDEVAVSVQRTSDVVRLEEGKDIKDGFINSGAPTKDLFAVVVGQETLNGSECASEKVSSVETDSAVADGEGAGKGSSVDIGEESLRGGDKGLSVSKGRTSAESPADAIRTGKESPLESRTEEEWSKAAGKGLPGACGEVSCDVEEVTLSLDRLVMGDSEEGDGGGSVAPQRTREATGHDHTVHSSFIQSLRTRLTGLSSSDLTLPSASPAFLQIETTPAYGQRLFPYEEVSYGFQTTPVRWASIVNSRCLTKEGALKTTMEVTLEVLGLEYEPGDAFGFICPNNEEEVEWLLHRLKLSERAEEQMKISVMASTTKKRASLPKHVPQGCSVRQFFRHCADIRCVPKKAFLHQLSVFCLSEVESTRLKELSSRQGAADYSELFTSLRTDLLDVLYAFPSCCPPLERLIESLPRLQPRYYSASSSPSCGKNLLRIAFNVEQLPPRSWGKSLDTPNSEGQSRAVWRRKGLATGWLEKEALRVKGGGITRKIPMYCRNMNVFHLPSNQSVPIVMVGPGTGVSPFMGFLEQREASRSAGNNVGKGWLFFGCRSPLFDHIFRDEMDHFLSTGSLSHLDVAYSRYVPEQPDTPTSSGSTLATPTSMTSATSPAVVDGPVCYVQDLMRDKWAELGLWIVKDHASVYVCGDAKNMAKDVHSALRDVLTKFFNESDHANKPRSDGAKSSTPQQMDAEAVLGEMKETGRYLVDVW